jgi:hypothetical protein
MKNSHFYYLEIDNLELEGVLFEGTSVKESNLSILVQLSLKILIKKKKYISLYFYFFSK